MLLIFILYENMRNHNLNINVREYRRDNQKGTIQRNWQHTQDEDKQNINITQYVFDTIIRKQTQIT